MSGAMEARQLLNKHSARKDRLQDLTAGGIAGIINPGRITRLWVDDDQHGYPFLSSTDILQADLSNVGLIAKLAAKKNPRLIIKDRCTLITRSGTVGRMVYSRSEMKGMACTEDVLRVIPDETKVSPGYIHAYLGTSFGIPQVVSGTYGSIITHLEPHHIADLPVPRLGAVEDKAHELVQQASDNLSEHQKLLNESTALVFSSCGLVDQSRLEWLTDNSDTGFSVTSKNLSRSFRALNHSRRAERIKNDIFSVNHSLLGDVLDLEWLRWRVMFQRIPADRDHGIEVITQKPLFNLIPKGKWISREYLLNHSPKYVVPNETILVAKQGTLGEHELYCRCEFITGERALARAYSDHCMRFVAKKDAIDPGYLFAFLRSQSAFRMLRSISEGSKQQDLHWRTVPLLPVPRSSSSIEKKIGEKIRHAFALRESAITMYEQARTLVERTIEAGGR